MEIPKAILDKYHLLTLAENIAWHGDSTDTRVDFYRDFLSETDHIPNKIIEAQTLGEQVGEYTEILQYRKYAREEINRLRDMEE